MFVLIVIDYGNGIYEVLFFILEFGIYFVLIVLDYLLCDGMKNFFDYWFMIGKGVLMFYLCN